ncbi:hypothetical protein [Pantoea sp. AS-PWVM4]|uniref:hypothetical protein n=1 Tax=Pantoea sp. AS-PWVM4 TaxID=1332069 RepID=UPI001268D0B7|nr:hypothetical protein [Pantoea sp. AS-PWVM4]
MEYVCVATEDVLSEAVALKLISLTNGRLIVSQKLRKNGFGYLKSKFPNFCNLSQNMPVILITDLDNCPCAPSLINNWKNGAVIPPNLIFRVAVREVESWILADHVGLSDFFKIPAKAIPMIPDDLPNPKSTLLSLAKKAPRDLKNGLIAKKGTLAIQGTEYNIILSDFVNRIWDPRRAAENSDSLSRAIKRVTELAEKYH